MTYEELDLNGDSIPDLVISGSTTGTDDVPSSGGICWRIVQPHVGSSLLVHFIDSQSHGPFQINAGDSISPAQLAEGLQRQKFIWWQEPIQVVGWSYGNWRSEPSVWTDEQERQTFVLKTEVDGSVQWCWFRIAYDAAIDAITISHGPLVDEEKPLHWSR